MRVRPSAWAGGEKSAVEIQERYSVRDKGNRGGQRGMVWETEGQANANGNRSRNGTVWYGK
jgi:hypothetical protein